jgi:hypothetical protein
VERYAEEDALLAKKDVDVAEAALAAASSADKAAKELVVLQKKVEANRKYRAAGKQEPYPEASL